MSACSSNTPSTVLRPGRNPNYAFVSIIVSSLHFIKREFITEETDFATLFRRVIGR